MHILKNKKILLLIGLLFLFLFFIFTLMVKEDLFNKFDFDTTVKLQNKLPHKFDRLLYPITFIGTFEIIIIPLLILLVFLRKKLFGFIAVSLFIFAHVTELIGKLFLTHPGPPFMFYRLENSLSFPSNYIQPGSSYPSGHAFRSIFVAALFLYVVYTSKRFSTLHKWLFTFGIIGLVFLIILGKVALGAHWTSDVIAGVLLGIGSSAIALLFY